MYHSYFPRQEQQHCKQQQQHYKQQQQHYKQQQQQHQQQQQQHQQQHQPPPATLRAGLVLLEAWAPRALRALYEKDQRRPFCPPALWTAPYDADEAAAAAVATQLQGRRSDSDSGGGAGGRSGDDAPAHRGLRAAAAVVQGLLFGGGDRGGGGSGASRSAGGAAASPSDPQQQAPAAAAAAAASAAPVAGGAPGAMAALLRAAPQCVPFARRVELFRSILQEDRARGRWDLAPADGGPRPLKLTVRRDFLLEDAFAALSTVRGDALKGRLHVTFVGASGAREAGLDHGGLTKELLELAAAAALDPRYGLFERGADGLAVASPRAEALPRGLELLEFAGAVVGKALYEGILLDLALAPPLVVVLQGGRPGADDLAGADAALAAGLAAVRGYAGDVSELGLTFSADVESFGRVRVR